MKEQNTNLPRKIECFGELDKAGILDTLVGGGIVGKTEELELKGGR